MSKRVSLGKVSQFGAGKLTKPDWKQPRMDRQTAVDRSGIGWMVNVIGGTE